MTRVLMVGIATLDIVNTVDCYPQEDAEVRALGQTIRRGGNAANSAVVLAQQGLDCDFLGVLAKDAGADRVIEEFRLHGVGYRACPRVDGVTPTSYIALSRKTGSRTIVHYRDVPEMQASAMDAIKPADYDWIHFEGRNVDQVQIMMSRLQDFGVNCSVEMEKPRDGLWALVPYANVIMLSRPFMLANFACDNQEQALGRLKALSMEYPGKRLSLTWGAAGAVGAENGVICRHEAPALEKAVDSIGAGDTFNAAIIGAAVEGLEWSECVRRGVQLASRKCAQHGFSGLGSES